VGAIWARRKLSGALGANGREQKWQHFRQQL